MNGRRIILAVGVVAFVIIISIAIFSIDWGGGDTPVRDGLKTVNISDYADTDVQVRMTARGPINSNQAHEELQITVGQNETTGNLLSGYQGNVSRSTQTGSNVQSYKSFLAALHNAQFTKKKLPTPGVQYDGVCPKGTRYTFEFLGGKDTPESSWATSCSKKDGTFDGNLNLVEDLFEAQIPKEQYRELVSNSFF